MDECDSVAAALQDVGRYEAVITRIDETRTIGLITVHIEKLCMIRNRDVFPETAAHTIALACVEAGVDAAHPKRVIRDHLQFDGERITVGDETYPITYQSVQIVGGGNAAGHVAVAIESILGDALNGGVVVTDDPVETTSVEVLPADHPIPEPARRRVDPAAARSGASARRRDPSLGGYHRRRQRVYGRTGRRDQPR